jgi:ParB family transcriptional regulator, chromosome partitioning protein
MATVVSISPFRCRMWELHDRIDAHVTEQTCRAEIDSYTKHGQLVPVLGRRVHANPEYDVELIYGARRLFVARHINKPLLVDLRELSDREAIIAMDIENRQRKDISPYERGVSYTRWLRSGHFSSQDEIARSLKVSPSQVSRLIKLARLPPVIVNAFENPLDICEGWGVEIVDALADHQRRQPTIDKARCIGAIEPRLAASEVYRQLITASLQPRTRKSRARDEVVFGENGRPLFRIRYHGKSIALMFPSDKLSTRQLQEIRRAITSILHHAPESPARESSLAIARPAVRSGRSRIDMHALIFEMPKNSDGR